MDAEPNNAGHKFASALNICEYLLGKSCLGGFDFPQLKSLTLYARHTRQGAIVCHPSARRRIKARMRIALNSLSV
jgi:hypothetical protein